MNKTINRLFISAVTMMVVAFAMKIKNKFRESKFSREQQDAERELYFRVKREADRVRRSREPVFASTPRMDASRMHNNAQLNACNGSY
jgi:hypothetical protein